VSKKTFSSLETCRPPDLMGAGLPGSKHPGIVAFWSNIKGTRQEGSDSFCYIGILEIYL